MAEHYYLVSSLPYLMFKEKPPFSLAAFLEQCASWLSAGEYRQVSLAKRDIENIPLEEDISPALRSWVAFENSLRTELVRQRASNLGVQAETYMRPEREQDPSVWSFVKDAMKDPSPYKIELSLLETRWKFLEDLEAGHPFDMTFLITYALKLQLLERLEKFEAEKGQKVFHIIYEGNKDEEERKYRQNNRD